MSVSKSRDTEFNTKESVPKLYSMPWLMWLSWLGIILQTSRPQVGIPVRACTCFAGLVPMSMFLFLSASLPLSLESIKEKY